MCQSSTLLELKKRKMKWSNLTELSAGPLFSCAVWAPTWGCISKRHVACARTWSVIK